MYQSDLYVQPEDRVCTVFDLVNEGRGSKIEPIANNESNPAEVSAVFKTLEVAIEVYLSRLTLFATTGPSRMMVGETKDTQTEAEGEKRASERCWATRIKNDGARRWHKACQRLGWLEEQACAGNFATAMGILSNRSWRNKIDRLSLSVVGPRLAPFLLDSPGGDPSQIHQTSHLAEKRKGAKRACTGTRVVQSSFHQPLPSFGLSNQCWPGKEQDPWRCVWRRRVVSELRNTNAA